MSFYAADLAFIHDDGFGEFARDAAPWLIERLPRGLVVDAGCGSGILARALTGAGFEVFGFDVSPAMIELARANAPSATLAVGSWTDVALPPCGAVLAIGEVLSYADGLASFIERAAAALAPGGVLVFDLPLHGIPLDDAHARDEDWEVFVTKELDGSILTRRITTFREVGGVARKSVEVHRVHLYDAAEVKAMLRGAGFRVETRRSYGRAKLPPGRLAFLAS